MLKQTLSTVDLINALFIFLWKIYLKINDHRMPETHGSYWCSIYLSCGHLPS